MHTISSQTSRAPSTVPRLLRSPRKLRKFRCLNPSQDRAIITLARAKFIKHRVNRNITVIINSKRDVLLCSKSALAKVRPIRVPSSRHHQLQRGTGLELQPNCLTFSKLATIRSQSATRSSERRIILQVLPRRVIIAAVANMER